MLVEVLVELSKTYGWEPVYCVSHRLREQIKRYFPSAIYHETGDARYGRFAPELAKMLPIIIDQPTAEALAYAEVMALKQMDRMELFGGFPTHDRIIHFNRLVGYWFAVFERLQPDVLLMPTAPHVLYDYVAYTSARRLGISVVMFEYVTNDGLLIAIDRFEDGVPPLTAVYQKLRAHPPSGHVVLSDRLEAHLRRLKGSYDQAIPSSTRQVLEQADVIQRAEEAARKQALVEAKAEEEPRELCQREIRYEKIGHRRFLSLHHDLFQLKAEAKRVLQLKAEAKRVPLILLAPGRAKPPGTDGYYNGRFYLEKEVPDDLARSAAEYRRRHLDMLIRRYDELAIVPDLNRPYIYVALHLQPERSTNPLGGVFDDQDVLVGMIASALPVGWRVYVKEHPSQFVPQYASERGRWATLYDSLIAFPEVVLVSRQTASFDLIDNARAVATIAGTSSWEAIVRGVPTLVFGEAWYKGCPGSYSIRTADDCRHALALIDAGEKPDPEALRLFLRAAEETSFVGYLGPDDAPIAGTDEATNIKRLARAIEECHGSSR